MRVKSKIFQTIIKPIEYSLIHKMKHQIASNANGKVLELGNHTHYNMNYYNCMNVKEVSIVANQISDIDNKVYPNKGIIYTQREGMAENLPYLDNTFDSVVFSMLLCSAYNPKQGMKEIRRVLKNNGRIYFVEHVRPKNPILRKVIDHIDGHWYRMSGGCSLNRHSIKLICDSGFEIDQLNTAINGMIIAGSGHVEKVNGLDC